MEHRDRFSEEISDEAAQTEPQVPQEPEADPQRPTDDSEDVAGSADAEQARNESQRDPG